MDNPIYTMQPSANYVEANYQSNFQPIQGPSQQIQALNPQYVTPSAPVTYYPNQITQQNLQSYAMPQPILLTNQAPQTIPATQDKYDWQLVQSKKRFRSPEEEKVRKQTKITNYWLQKPMETRNRFDELTNQDEETNGDKTNHNSEPKPPPITVYQVGTTAPIHKLLQDIAQQNYSLKSMGTDKVKIQVKSAEHYLKVIEELEKKETQFHTYRTKSNKTFRVVLKGLHHSTEINDIKENLKQHNHEVENVYNIKHSITKNPLSMFYIDLKSKENNKEIYSLKTIGNNIVQFEPPRSKREIPQCSRCQEFGHTKNYCKKIARCVKCVGLHLTKDCPRKSRDDMVKCVNCGENHPANYRGCIIHKQLQQRLYPTLREKNPQQRTAIVTQTNQTRPGTSYAQVINGNNQNIPNNQSAIPTSQHTSNMSKLEEMLSKLMEQMGTMLNLLTAVIAKLT